MADITLAQLLEAGVHFGHKAYRWNPKMFPYIYTERNSIHILDLSSFVYSSLNNPRTLRRTEPVLVSRVAG